MQVPERNLAVYSMERRNLHQLYKKFLRLSHFNYLSEYTILIFTSQQDFFADLSNDLVVFSHFYHGNADDADPEYGCVYALPPYVHVYVSVPQESHSHAGVHDVHPHGCAYVHV